MASLNGSFFEIAMHRLSLFRPTKKSKILLNSLSEVTGYQLATLLQVERQMTRQGSLKPLKELLNTKEKSRADRLQYKIGLTNQKGPRSRKLESVINQFTLNIATERGTVDVLIKIKAKRTTLEFCNERQSATIEINYKIRSKSIQRRFRQELKISGISPAFNPVNTTNIQGYPERSRAA